MYYFQFNSVFTLKVIPYNRTKCETYLIQKFHILYYVADYVHDFLCLLIRAFNCVDVFNHIVRRIKDSSILTLAVWHY